MQATQAMQAKQTKQASSERRGGANAKGKQSDNYPRPRPNSLTEEQNIKTAKQNNGTAQRRPMACLILLLLGWLASWVC